MSPDTQLTPGTHYRVRISGYRNATRRIFKWDETRHGSIKCFVFTAPVRANVQAEWNPTTQELRLTGPSVPASELSVPHYDLLSVNPL